MLEEHAPTKNNFFKNTCGFLIILNSDLLAESQNYLRTSSGDVKNNTNSLLLRDQQVSKHIVQRLSTHILSAGLTGIKISSHDIEKTALV